MNNTTNEPNTFNGIRLRYGDTNELLQYTEARSAWYIDLRHDSPEAFQAVFASDGELYVNRRTFSRPEAEQLASRLGDLRESVKTADAPTALLILTDLQAVHGHAGGLCGLSAWKHFQRPATLASGERRKLIDGIADMLVCIHSDELLQKCRDSVWKLLHKDEKLEADQQKRWKENKEDAEKTE